MIVSTQTTAPLGASAVFTGAQVPVWNRSNSEQRANTVQAFFLADQTSPANGAVLEGSDDGTTWYTVDSSTLTAKTPLTLSAPAVFRYFRTSLTNGTTAQTSLVIKLGIQ